MSRKSQLSVEYDEKFAASVVEVSLMGPDHPELCQWCSVNDVREFQLRQEAAAALTTSATLRQDAERYAAEASSISLSARNWKTAFRYACMVIAFFVAYEAYKVAR